MLASAVMVALGVEPFWGVNITSTARDASSSENLFSFTVFVCSFPAAVTDVEQDDWTSSKHADSNDSRVGINRFIL